ncbi:MAG: hypothetical protein JSV00_06960 [bacterium]|nr:MAG: hypothetical protein JSV00_06960 [bacterium]
MDDILLTRAFIGLVLIYFTVRYLVGWLWSIHKERMAKREAARMRGGKATHAG